MTTYNLCIAGFGNVGRALVRLLQSKSDELHTHHGINWRLTGVARRKEWHASADGLDPAAALQNVLPASERTAPDIHQWIKAAQPDVLFETTSLTRSGRPAIDHLQAALEAGAHAISANKGPVVYAYRELSELAAKHKRRFLFESAVMDGVPIFSLFRETLPAVELRGFHGILNSTTNVILGEIENGLDFDAAVKKAQELGVAETDPSDDISGWDAVMKVTALANVLMGERLRPENVEREGVADLKPHDIRLARAAGTPYKLVCRVRREDGRVIAAVRPERLPLSDPMALVSGTSSMVYFETDIFPGLAITEENPGLEATAYGLLADFIRAVRNS